MDNSFFVRGIPREVWRSHICLFLDKGSLAALRLTCSYFRKEVVFSSPVWYQWIPYRGLAKSLAMYKELGWERERFVVVYGVYFDELEDFSHELFQSLPRSLEAIDFLSLRNVCRVSIESISYFPTSLRVLNMFQKKSCDIPEEYFTALYTHFPSLEIKIPKMDGRRLIRLDNAFYYVCKQGYVSTVRFLLLQRKQEIKSFINQRNLINQRTPLCVACKYCRIDVVSLLLENGADPNISERASYTPLMWACVNANADMVSLLLRHGADRSVKENRYGYTALGIADERRAFGCASILSN